jgi:uncharacterized protein YyaL (SSP411 family)
LHEAKKFALRSLDRILAAAWNEQSGLAHVVAYSDSASVRRDNDGFLDDYAFTACACLDAYEATADLTYVRESQRIIDQMITRFYDEKDGGFLDAQRKPAFHGVLATPRKPFQDSPTPAGNPSAAIALVRLHAYTGDESYRNKAEATLDLLAGTASQYGIFAATYGIAATYAAYPHEHVVIIGEDETASKLFQQAVASAGFGRTVLKLKFGQAAAQNLPPALANTIPQLPDVKAGRTTAIVCSGFTCKPPAHTGEELKSLLQRPAA